MRSAEEIQREQVEERKALVQLQAACTVGNGVLRMDEALKKRALDCFRELKGKPAFFVPASGSGSRMFQFLFEWSESLEEEDDVQDKIDQMSTLAAVKEYLNAADSVLDLTKMLLKNVASKPKGLIPFHSVNGKVYTAFQEHALQVKKLFPDGAHLHFTVQRKFEEEIKRNLSEIQADIHTLEISYSQQDPDSDAYCYDAKGRRVDDDDHPLRRPAGHGALLDNLNRLDHDLVCIKNIDNVQHFSKSDASTEVWKMSIGLLLAFQKDLRSLQDQMHPDYLAELNARYGFLSAQELEEADEDFMRHLLARPTRVCGMVKNEGEPGGGPFWINDKGRVSKQIIEKIQISGEDDQQEIVAGSSHFNPVFIVVSKTDVFGQQLDLLKFRDDSKYFIVHKSHKGGDIWYRELPGLWNGGMSDWNTLFLEIPSEVFSPVKTILDLAKPLHQP
jgi:hypothetical protein